LAILAIHSAHLPNPICYPVPSALKILPCRSIPAILAIMGNSGNLFLESRIKV
jgi:hypothetical protein